MWTSLNPRMTFTEIILTYASSSKSAFPFYNSGTMLFSSANTVEVTVTESHRFPFGFAKTEPVWQPQDPRYSLFNLDYILAPFNGIIKGIFTFPARITVIFQIPQP